MGCGDTIHREAKKIPGTPDAISFEGLALIMNKKKIMFVKLLKIME